MSDVTEIVECDHVVAGSPSSDARPRRDTVTGRLVGFTRMGAAIVDAATLGGSIQMSARSCVSLTHGDIDKQVVLMFEERSESPIIVGVIQPERAAVPMEVTVDGTNISLTAQDSVSLKCGDASITLTRDGKVVIRGKHVVTHAVGVNRIRGGSVQLN